jgi:monofunctional biosynthetic peptidoglycan transglycosylase
VHRFLVVTAGLLLLVAVVVGWTAYRAAGFQIAPLNRRAPARTAVMREREAEAARIGRKFRIDVRPVPYDRISPLLRRAVLVAEDDAFFSHDGLDWNEIRASARANLSRGRVVRGGSTITQQLAKNLFLGSARTLTRKLEEVFLAGRLERSLTKRRIFELYLNLIEWGDGIFGAEAAARHYFGVAASDLSPRQAVLLAAVIINPRRFSVLDPQRRIERRVKLIAGRLRRRGDLSEVDYRAVLALPPLEPALVPTAPEGTTIWPPSVVPDSPAPGAPVPESLPAPDTLEAPR